MRWHTHKYDASPVVRIIAPFKQTAITIAGKISKLHYHLQ